MKKTLLLSLTVLLALSSCGTYTGAGAYTGAQFGSIIGSAVGGISGGWRGHEVGKLIGLAGGAAVGAAVGSAADRAAEERRQERAGRYEGRTGINTRQVQDDSGYDPQGRGDDRITMDGGAMPRGYVANAAALEISHVQLVDATNDGQLKRDESAHIVFEIRNTSSKPIYSVQPSVREMTGNKHIHISENILVECIRPNEVIRYTAQVKADCGLRNGEAVVQVSVFQAGREVSSQNQILRIATFKR